MRQQQQSCCRDPQGDDHVDRFRRARVWREYHSLPLHRNLSAGDVCLPADRSLLAEDLFWLYRVDLSLPPMISGMRTRVSQKTGHLRGCLVYICVVLSWWYQEGLGISSIPRGWPIFTPHPLRLPSSSTELKRVGNDRPCRD